MGGTEYIGKRVVLRMDGDSRFDDTDADLFGTITGFANRPLGPPVLEVSLDEMKVSKRGSEVRAMVIAGIGMSVVSELFGTPGRPKSLPIVVAVWRIADAASFERLRTESRPPSGSEFIGHATIALAAP